MSACTIYRCTIAVPGKIEVVTLIVAGGEFETQINGGRFDGDRFTCTVDPDAQHDGACDLAQSAALPLRRRRPQVNHITAARITRTLRHCRA